MVICLELGADLHIMVQLMPLPLTVSCFSGFTFWYWLTQVVPDKGPLNGCVCVCVLLKGGEGKRRGGGSLSFALGSKRSRRLWFE